MVWQHELRFGDPGLDRQHAHLGCITFDALRDGDVLMLVDTDSSFDFGAGSTSATLRVVMKRT